MTCPQCKQEIELMKPRTYVVGWCRLDIHKGCYALHCRTCQPCLLHNAAAMLKLMEPVAHE